MKSYPQTTFHRCLSTTPNSVYTPSLPSVTKYTQYKIALTTKTRKMGIMSSHPPRRYPAKLTVAHACQPMACKV